ncbi:MAG: ribonuclease P protein component [Thermomicrobiales bacterium]|nr:ribonuclease P protein component [Thermomicrobiales bacterium]
MQAECLFFERRAVSPAFAVYMGSCMVERKYRLREDHEVKRVRSRGRSVAHRAIVLRYMPNALEPPQNRYTVIAGKRCGNSVQRNRLKRIVREALRGYHPYLVPGHDIAVVCRGGVEEMPDTRTAQEYLTTILNRTDLIQPGSELPKVGVAVTASWRDDQANEERTEC